MSIQVFSPLFKTDEILEEMRDCLDKGWTGLGYKTVAFENAWNEYTGLKHSHFLTSNTVGLHLAFHVLKKHHGWSDGDEVITTPLTFVSTNHAILYENLAPVFADVDESLCLDPKSVEARITPRTKAVIFVGIGGNVGQYERIVELCRHRGLQIILDAAHMSGTRVHGKHVGSDADVTVFSFQAVKNLPTADSGMICFQDEKLDALARGLSWLGINKDTYQRSAKGSYRWKYDVPNLGFKYHGNSIQAAIGIVQLKYLDADNARRREIADFYDRRLKGLPGLSLVAHSPECVSSRHLYQVRLKDRDSVLERFYAADIYPGVHYTDNKEYPMYHDLPGDCPNARAASSELISLPLHLRLSDEDCEAVVKVLKDTLAASSAS